MAGLKLFRKPYVKTIAVCLIIFLVGLLIACEEIINDAEDQVIYLWPVVVFPVLAITAVVALFAGARMICDRHQATYD